MSRIIKLFFIAAASLCVSFIGKKPDSKADSGRAKNIDGLRAILSLIIVLFHFGQLYSLGPVFRSGWFAVEFFFMISGFLLISGAVSKGDSFSPVCVLTSRIKRMYPAYLVGTVSLILLYAVTWFGGSLFDWMCSDDNYPLVTIVELLCLQTTGASKLIYVNGPAWYVSALLITTGILAILYSKVGEKIFPIAGVLSVSLYALMFTCCPSMPSAGFFPHTIIPVPLMRAVAGMCLGTMMYGIYSSRWFDITCAKLPYPEQLMAMSLLLAVIPLVFLEYSRAFYLLFAPATIFILLAFKGYSSVCDVVLKSSPIQYLGKISFSFYIMQSFSQNVVQIYISPYIQNPWVLNTVYILFNLAVATVVYALIESRFARKKK